MDSTTPNRTQAGAGLVVTAAYYAAFIGLGLGFAAIGPTLPGLAQHTRTHLSEISFLFTAHSLGYLVGSLAAGHIYDRVRGHPVMAGMLVVLTAMMFLIPVMPLLWLLTVTVFVLGLAGALLDVGANALLVWVHRDKVAPYMNGLHAFFGVGTFIAPIVIAQLVLISGDITWAYWVLGLSLLPVAVWLLRLPSPAHVKATGDKAPAAETNYRLVTLLVLLWILYVGAEYSMGGWLYSYALKMNMADATTAAYLTSVFWGAFTFARLAGIPISMRLRPRHILLGDFAVCILGGTLILLFPASQVILWTGTVLIGFGMASIIPVILSLAERRMVITARVTSFFFAGGAVGGMTLPWIIGQLFESVGPQVAIWGIVVNLALSTIVLFMVLRTAAVRPVPARSD
jgi:fucose permease